MAKKFLDESGLSSLWAQIRNGYAGKWKVVNFDTFTYTPHKDTDGERGDIIIQTLSTTPTKDANGNYVYKDEFNWDEACDNPANELVTIFKDGKMVKEQSLSEIRNILHGGKF